MTKSKNWNTKINRKNGLTATCLFIRHQFAMKIKARYISERPHREVPQQRGVVGRIDPEMVVNKASHVLNCDGERLRERKRLYGQDKDNRDLMVYVLWERGSFTNREIGEFFSVSYTAVSHIVKKVKGQLKTDKEYAQRYELINSQIKM